MIYDEKILKNGLCTAIPTAEMTRREWLEARRRGIGGSDAGAVLGMNRYSSPLSVYLSKKGFGNNGEKESPALRWGKMAENAIRDGIARDMGLLIEEAPVMFSSIKHPFMLAGGTDSLQQAQTASVRDEQSQEKNSDEKNGLPDNLTGGRRQSSGT